LWLALAGLATAQTFSVDLYEDVSYDADTIYATGVLQGTPQPGCAMCASAYHTYQQTVTINSPTGRNSSCSFNYGNPASSSVNYQCGTSMSIAGETGDFTATDTPTVYCSMFGLFVNASIPKVIKVAIGLTYSQSTQGTANPDGMCPQIDACTRGTVARCHVSGVYEGFGNFCYPYYFTPFVIINGSCYPPVGVSLPAGGPGPCQ